MKKVLKIFSLILIVILLLTSFACAVEEEKTYDVGNDKFSYISYVPQVQTSLDVKTGETKRYYSLKVDAVCSLSLFQYNATVSIYRGAEKIDTVYVRKDVDVNANKVFSFNFDVSEYIYDSVTSVQVNFSGKSNQNPSDEKQSYNVIFYNQDEVYSITSVEKGKTVSTPKDPKINNFVFVGWYEDLALTKKYDFSQQVNKNLVLYAKYNFDAVSISNQISQDTIKSIVKVTNKSYDTFLGFETDSTVATGTGFCFLKQNGYCFILTNCYVAMKRSGYDNQKITIKDYKGNEYEGHIYANPNKTTKAISAEYDLACIYIKTSTSNIKSLAIENENSREYSEVISLESSIGQTSTPKFGKIFGYEKVTSSLSAYLSNVKFDLIHHTASNNTSSGGVLLNEKLKVVGINLYVPSSTTYGRAIPAEKIQEFLTKYVYN